MRLNITSFQEAEEYINNIPKFTAKHSMEETKAFLKRLGQPQKGIPIIHVAGTNGKGSVCAYLAAILSKAGYRVGLFTSPHLVDIRERFVCDGEEMSREDFVYYTNKVLEYVEDPDIYHPTYFEFLFFLALLWYEKKRPEVLILETGLGGRLDATNSIEEKEMTIITRIGLDHVQYLGDTIEKIAYEKAGIMREGVPCFYNAMVPEAEAVFIREADQKKVPLFPVGKDAFSLREIKKEGIAFSIFTRYYKCVSLCVSSPALYQMENVSLAVRAAEEFDWFHRKALSGEIIEEAVRLCHWSGRMDEILPGVFLDGAHNSDGIRAFLESVAQDGFTDKRWLLFSAVSDKDYQVMIRELLETKLFSEISIVQLHTQRGLSTEELSRVFEEVKDCGVQRSDLHICEDAANALEDMLQRRTSERIYVAGSLYLVGELMERFKND